MGRGKGLLSFLTINIMQMKNSPVKLKSFFLRIMSLFTRCNTYSLLSTKEDWIVTARRNYYNHLLTKKLQNSKQISSIEVDNIKKFWHTFHKNATKLFNLDWYSVYNKHKKETDELLYYIPDDFYFCYFDTYFTNYHVSIELDNKNMYDLYFHDINRPTTLVRKMNGILLNYAYAPIDIDYAVNLCILNNDVIIKQAINSDGGKGIQFINDCALNKEELKRTLIELDNFIIQKIIEQHQTLASFNPQSVNTIRIMTFYWKNKPIVLSSVFRMGANGATVDNASSGGVVCGINKDGTLNEIAFDSKAKIYYTHPQGKRFKGTAIPSYQECIKIASELAVRFINYSKLISWDFSVAKDGTPVLIEANFTGGGVNIHQMCNGPIFSELLNDILTEIFNNSKHIKQAIH